MGGVFGRPKIGLRRVKVVSLLAAAAFLMRQWSHGGPPSFVRRWTAFLSKFHPAQVLLLTWMAHYGFSNAALLLGMNAPDHNVPYNSNFFRAIWVLTAANAAFITADHIRIPWLRDFFSLALVPYFLFYHEDAENRMHRYRQCTNVAQIRASFEGVPRHPVLQWLAALRRPALGVFRRRVLIPRRSVIHGVDATDDENIECFIYYRGRPEVLPNCTRVVLQFHGGGFVAMNPQCHEDYMCKIAKQLDAVLVCVNYRKAPEHPYPAGLNDCFDVYETLRDDNGRCVGITPTSFSNGLEQPLTIVLMGDSAGGNLAAAVCLRVLLINEHATSEEEYLREPDGVHLIYPSLHFDPPFWRTVDILAPEFDANASGADMIEAFENISQDPLSSPVVTQSSPESLSESSSLMLQSVSSASSGGSAHIVETPEPSPAVQNSNPAQTPNLRHSSSLVRFQPPKGSGVPSPAPSGMRRSASHARFTHHIDEPTTVASTPQHHARNLVLTSLTRPASFVSLISLVNTEAAAAAPASAVTSPSPQRTLSSSRRNQSFSTLAAAAAAAEPAKLVGDASAVAPGDTQLAVQQKKNSGRSALFTQLPKLPMFASHVRFVNDRILGPNRVTAMAECYLANGGDPSHDMFLSPLIAPSHLLQRFPRTFIHVGEVDPLIDDSVLFCKRLREARADRPVKLKIFPGISHAYMQLGILLPETQIAVDLTIDWLHELLTAPALSPQ